ncbi:hypothetical protein F5148DRAFT_1189424 [Russula earlei]|uniref:Uncharacterized protein n=1 Tax=Russula earlei TaxID=71964 RepID=A0ACC0UC81_9AGAM|nr:hypothetical protein F5148DRAFT_1189424 [Russula earlei]
MSGKLDSFSAKQARGGIQSDCKLPGARRLPFADITNMLDGGLGRHDEPSSPPPQSHALSGVATQNEGGFKLSDSVEAHNGLTHCVAPVRNSRAIPPSSPRSAPLPGLVPCLNGHSIRPKSIRRQVSLGSGALTRRPYEPHPLGDPASNDVSHYGTANGKHPLPSYPGTSTREPLSTSLLPSMTHKLACGQLAILPSRSVLVDFREGERRKGRKGDQVMVVSPNGDQIHIFSAPHLSTPCCLAEPIVTHSLNALPEDQYKLYEQAKKVIEHIKRNIPKVVMYEGNFVCTLMANEPRGDVEIRSNPRSTSASMSASTTAAIRVRFSRKLRTMQIFSSEPRVCKKTMFCNARGVPTDAGDWALLTKNEKECLAALLDFLRVVEAVEGLPRGASELLCGISSEHQTKPPTKREPGCSVPSAISPRDDEENDACRPRLGLSKPSATPAVPLPSATAPEPARRSIKVAISPRPRFPSALPRAASHGSDTSRKASSSTAVSDAPAPPPPSGDRPSSHITSAENVASLQDLSGGAARLQTRFMPGVGWCVRSGGARYRIMFTDGAALEVDVDKERVEVVECDGSVVRFSVRECSASRKVGDRMKVFREFLPLFDESGS